MHKITLLEFIVIVGTTIAAMPALAQQNSIPNVGGGIGSITSRPQRRLHKNRNPALSPALNMIPGAANSFSGQFLLRTIPQEQTYRNNAQATRNFERLDGQIHTQQAEIRTGVGQSGHTATFMSYGRYYQMNGVGARH